MKLGIPKEVFEGERRVATTPEVVPHLVKLGFEIIVQAGAGERANLADSAYESSGATIVPHAATVWKEADIILKVRAPQIDPTTGRDEADYLRENQTLISFFWPAQNESRMQELAEKRINLLSMDSVPRI
ncbi:MAG: NAD(P)(+) transhydrogenase (Re/Si-specific) subunit alpha, partial [Proteobacteria bacterium]